jgi:hypothetical protein
MKAASMCRTRIWKRSKPTAEVEKIDRQIQARKLSIRMNAGAGRRTVAEPNAATRPAGSGARVIVGARDQARQGFQSFGHFAQTVLNHIAGQCHR